MTIMKLFSCYAKRALTGFALVSALMTAGCTSDNGDSGKVPGPGSDVTLPDDPEQPTGEISFTATQEWYIEVTDGTRAESQTDWVVVYPTEGQPGDFTLNVVAQPNTTGESRTAIVTLHDGDRTENYTISQTAAAAATASQQLYKVMPDARTLEVDVTANARYRVRISPYDSESSSWIKLTDGDGSARLTFELTVNDRLEARNALVEFMSESGDRQLGYCIVRQAGIRTVEGHTTVEIPDAAFAAFLLENFDTNKDGEMSLGEMGGIEYMDCSGRGIASLEGIECCDHLLYLDCSRNSISQLDLTECTELQTLIAEECSIVQIYLGNNTELTQVRLNDNPLQTLRLGNLPQLQRLVVSNTQLSSLNLAGYGALEYLSATDCRIATVNLSGCRKLKSAYLGGNLLRHIDLRSLPALEEYGVNLVESPYLESVHADVQPSVSPNGLVVMWYTETGKHCVYTPFVYVKGKLTSQQIDVGLDFPTDF